MHRRMGEILIMTLTAACNCLAQPREPDRLVVYKTTTDQHGKPVELRLHVFTPRGSVAAQLRPAIVFFFGGGWQGGTPTQFYPQCAYLASRGMVAMAAEYRVKSVHGTDPRACVKDGKSAIRWIRRHAGKLGIDPQKIAAGGGSAGGHVAAAAGTTAAFEEPGEDLTVSSRPNALVLFNPVFDNGPGAYGHDRVAAFWKEFSPMHNIDEHTPPTIVFLGAKDELIPVSTAERYKALMEAAGHRCDLHVYTGQPHGFFNPSNPEYYARTVVAMDRFLTSLGYLEGEPTLPPAKGRP